MLIANRLHKAKEAEREQTDREIIDICMSAKNSGNSQACCTGCRCISSTDSGTSKCRGGAAA